MESVTRQAVIPAKGLSRGLPQKNLADINGESLVARAVRVAAPAVDRVVVLTDDPRIGLEAERAGAYVAERPEHFSREHEPPETILSHTCRLWPCDRVALVQCTAPLMVTSDIDHCLRAIDDPDMLAVACVRSHGVRVSEVHRIAGTRRQDREPQWVIAGSVWACQPRYVLEWPWYGGMVVPVEQWSPWRVDIDTADDLRLARLLLSSERSGVIVE